MVNDHPGNDADDQMCINRMTKPINFVYSKENKDGIKNYQDNRR